MSFQLGGNTPSNWYLGGSVVAKAYLGADLVYPSGIVPFVYSVDRRPIFQGGYATQTYASTGDIKYGVNNQNYRKTPATGQSMTNTATNGKLAWLTDKVKPAADRGFERFHLTNIAGWTSFSDQGNDQPHFPSNSYTGLALTSVDVYVNQDDTTGAITQATPFTNDGMSTGSTIGDNKEAWAEGVAQLKSWVTGTPEVTSYQGYRPCYGELAMSTLKKDVLGYSKASTNAAGWTGTGTSPGFTPEPGYDGVGGFSSSTAAFAAWFDEEIAGLMTLGFDGIGLDTGTRVWDNSGGRANGTELGTVNPDGTVGDDRLVEYFNSQGLKPVFESVGLDTWTQGAGKSAAPATDGRYAESAYWGYFGSWWGYEGDANGEAVVEAHYDKSGTGTVEAPSGGWFFDTGLCGNAANAAAFGAEAEVHVIFQWGTGTYMSRIMQGTGGDAVSGNGVGWTGMKQIMWDCREAGMIVSASGSLTTDMTVTDPNTAVAEVITWEMFLDYVTLLYTDPALVRPADSVVTDWDTEPISYFYSAGATGEVPVTYTFNTTPWDTLQAAGGVAYPETTSTSGTSMRMNTSVSGGWDSDAVATAFPHVYIWNTKYGSNNGWDKVTQVTSGNFKPNINFDGVNHAYAFDDNVPECAYAFYATDQGDISGWSAYNGPTETLDYTDYMTANAGVDHAVIPFATGITDNITLAGDGSSTWATFTTSVGVVYPLDTVSGETVTAPATNKRALYGPNSAQSNPYQYAAIGWREASGQYQGVASAGWIVLEREQTIGSFNPTFQAYFPVEGTDGINGVTPYDNGALPAYNNSGGTGSLDHVMFFFDGYQAGDVDTWTVWDGVTTP